MGIAGGVPVFATAVMRKRIRLWWWDVFFV